jgi:DNA (cytosine-5)-methyltransferase 1
MVKKGSARVVPVTRKGDKKEMRKIKTIDLFAGVGGVRMGFEKAGFQTVFANDFDKTCKSTYDLNFSEPKLDNRDLWSINPDEFPKFDILLGGFPCQAFSVAGYRKGFRDEKGRGNLFFKVAEIIDARRPRAFFLENVKNLKGHDHGRTFTIIKETLEGFGYHVKAEVLNSMVHGAVPQNRERIFIVGFLDKKAFDKFEFPKPIPLKSSFKEFLSDDVDMKYYYTDKPMHAQLSEAIESGDTVYQWRRRYVRANKRSVVPTLTANMGRGGHNVPIVKTSKGIRKLTPKECFLFQGFPQSYKLPKNLPDSHLYHQAGNSVTVPVVARIAKNMASALSVSR